MSKYVCQICGYVYDEDAGAPDSGIAPGTKWEQLPDNWKCPLCGAEKGSFKKQEEKAAGDAKVKADDAKKGASAVTEKPSDNGSVREMKAGELFAICSNLARGCEKQYRSEEAKLFTELAEYFASLTPVSADANFDAVAALTAGEFDSAYPEAGSAADSAADRGAKRILVWSEKVTRSIQSLLSRYGREGAKMLENTKLWVCDICGFIYVGDEPPAVCPVCKVPSFKILEVK